MFMEQKDLLWGLDKSFIKGVVKIAEKETYEKGRVLFREGDPASDLYILIKGHVRLTLGDTGHSIYIVSHPGEVFGWSSVIGRHVYTASAVCVQETQVFRIEAKALSGLLESDPKNAVIFFKRIAAALGNRLLNIYQLATPAATVKTFGSSRVQEYPEAEAL